MRIPRKVKTKVVTSEDLDPETVEQFVETYEGGTYLRWAGDCWLITAHNVEGSAAGLLHSFTMAAVPDDNCS